MSGEHEELYTEGEPNLITGRRGGYAAKVGKQGYLGMRNQVHHVLPCGALTKSKDFFLTTLQEDAAGYKLALERLTIYNVNEKHNLIGLPTPSVYAAKFETPMTIFPTMLMLLPTVLGPVASCTLPVHTWGHQLYSKLAEEMADSVWDNLSVTIENHKPVSGNDLGDSIKNISDRLRSRLEDPRKGLRRTRFAWPDRAIFSLVS